MTEPKKKKSLFRFSSVDWLLTGVVIGLVASNIAGFSYLAAAREMNRKVMQAYQREMQASLSGMPASAQLVASFASRRAMEAAVRENGADPFWAPVFHR